MKTFIKKYILKGSHASWRHPLAGLAFKILDPFESIIRYSRNLSHIPPYSIRVRSNGTANQFGGRKFDSDGRLIAKLLIEHAEMKKSSHVLEVGCGCGRTAIALTDFLTDGKYIGMDIEKTALKANTSKKYFGKDFSFELMDIHNFLYNPDGRYKASSYVFPYDNDSFDVIFLISVFTHMRTKDVSNYIKEFGRLLNKGGRCFLSIFLVGYSRDKMVLDKFSEEGFYYSNEKLPEATIGYGLDFIVDEFMKCGLVLKGKPIVDSGIPQDILVFEKVR